MNLAECFRERLDSVCEEIEVAPWMVESSDRHAPLPHARQLIAWLLYRDGFNLVAIASAMGRNPTTVSYYIRNLERRRRSEWLIADRCSRLQRRSSLLSTELLQTSR